MKTLRYISAIVFALLSFFLFTTIQAADQATGLISAVIETASKIRIPVNTDDGESRGESSQNNSAYGEIFIIDSTMMRYELIEQTIITDAFGNKLTPDQLRAPCTVKMVAQKLGSGYYNALEIVVESCSSGASDAWFEQTGD